MVEWGPRAGLDFMDKRRISYQSHTLQSSPTGLSLTIIRYIKVVKALRTHNHVLTVELELPTIHSYHSFGYLLCQE